MNNNDNLWPGDYDFFRELWNNNPENKGVVIINGHRRYKGGPDSEFGDGQKRLFTPSWPQYPDHVDDFGALKKEGVSIRRYFLHEGRMKSEHIPLLALQYGTAIYSPSRGRISEIAKRIIGKDIFDPATIKNYNTNNKFTLPDLFRIPDWDFIYKQITDEEKENVLTKHFECGVPQYDHGRYTGILVTSDTRYKDYIQYKQKLIGKYTGLSEWLVGFADYLHVKLHNIKNPYGL